MNKILSIKTNCMGTLSFDAKFNGMRKAQDFIVYPIHKGNDTSKIMIQSDTRIGHIELETGKVLIAGPFAGGAYSPHLIFEKEIDRLDTSELAGLKFRLVQTAGDTVGQNALHVVTDNSGADKVTVF